MDFKELEFRPVPVKIRRSRAPFLRGPIPLAWLGRAACLPGRVLHVGLALWHLSTLRKSKTVKMQGKILALFGISRKVYAHGLKRLEGASLISVQRQQGASPTVTILRTSDSEKHLPTSIPPI